MSVRYGIEEHKAFMELFRQGLVSIDNPDTKGWTKFRITEKGRAVVDSELTPAAIRRLQKLEKKDETP